MTKPKHTPGPWNVADSKWAKCKYIVAGKRVIATVHGNASEDYQANAELFASAPELAECLRDLLHGSQLKQTQKRSAALLERLGM